MQKALDFHEQGEVRLSWGYCTAAAIKSWAVSNGIIFPPDAAESECADIINSIKIDSLAARKFDRLIKNWVNLAYAGQLPSGESFKEAVEFVRAQYG